MAEAEARDAGRTSASGPGTQAPPVAHDDIMRRLLEYQRRLREGMSPSEAAAAVAEGIPEAPAGGAEPQGIAATEEATVVDLTKAEAELEAQAEAGEARTEAEEPSAIGDRSEAATAPTSAEPSAATSGAAPMAEASPASPEVAAPAPSAGPEPQIPAWATPPSSVWATPSPAPDLVARVERLERTLEEVATKVSDLRQRFQDLAVAADERLAELERILGRARQG